MEIKVKKSLSFLFLLMIPLCILSSLSPVSAMEINTPNQKNLKEIKVDKKSVGTYLTKQEEKPSYVEGELIIKYKSSYGDMASRNFGVQEETFLVAKGLERKNALAKYGVSLVKIVDGESLEDKVSELEKDPNVEYVHPNYILTPFGVTSNDPHFNMLWGLHNTGQRVNGTYGLADKDIDAPEAWARSTGQGVVIAVIDNGVAYDHPDLAGTMWDGTNCLNHLGNYLGGCIHGFDVEYNDKDPYPNDYVTSSHGTHIAGTIAAKLNNANGIVGVAPDSKIMAIKTDLTVFDAAIAIDFANKNGADIINASWGFDQNIQLLYDAIRNFPGLFVAAAGNGKGDGGDNHDNNQHIYPCDFNLDNIICVAATDQRDGLAPFSDYGNLSVDVGAPGVNIFSTVTYRNFLREDFSTVPLLEIPQGWIRGGYDNYWGVRKTDFSPLMYFLYGDTRKPYYANSDTYLTSPTYNLSGSSAGRVVMDLLCDTPSFSNGYDRMYANFSGDDGGSWNGGSWWDEKSLEGITGSMRWSLFPSSMVLPDADFNLSQGHLTNRFRLALGWITDSYDNDYWGCGVTNLRLYGNEKSYDYYQGTSMAAPHTAGIAALLWSYRPHLTVAQVKAAILNSGESVSSLQGKTVTGKRVNAYNSLVSVQGDIIQSFVFNIDGKEHACTISERTKTIKCSLPADISKTNIAPVIVLTGGSITPATNVPRNFLENQIYTFTTSRGQEVYTVEIESYFTSSLNFRSGRNNWGVPNTRFLTSGDFNGDGKDEIAAMYDYGSNDMGIWLFNSQDKDFDSSLRLRSGKNNWGVSNTRFLTSGDFDGDGRDEIAAMYDYGNNDMGIWVFSLEGDSFVSRLWLRSGGGNWGVSNTRFLTSGDYTGDGKDEIAAMYDYGNNDMGIWIFSANGASFQSELWLRSGKGNWGVPNTRFLTSGDFTGDGKGKLAAMYDYGNNDMGIWVFSPNGASFQSELWLRSGKGNWGVPNTKFLTSGDYTGDGKGKLAAIYDYGNNDMGIWVFNPNGASFQSELWLRSGKGNWGVPNTKFLTSGDFNGNGIKELAAMYDYGNNDMGIWVFR